MTFAAVFPPMSTPFADDEVDVKAIASNIARWLQAGVGGVVALGSNGEAPLLGDDESDRVVAAAREAIPAGRLLIAGTGRESTRDTIAASKRAASLGADAVLVRTPAYFKSRMTHEAFVRHYSSVADAVRVPVLLYNYPAVTGVNLLPETIGRLAEHPNIAGVKETGSDAGQMAAYVDQAPARFSVICGSMPVFYASLGLGAVGGIVALACVKPDLCVRIFQAFRDGRHDEARRLQREATPLARLITTGFGVPGLKAAMDLAGYHGGAPREPLSPAPPQAIEQIKTELHRLEQHGC
jgi:4-hydroxy-2-oxoglutarate aldolase